jgi:hypothetical protein
MKKFITTAVSLFSLTVLAQVGINNDSPKATLDITAKTTDGSKPEGLLAPRLTGDQIQTGDAMYTAAQKGMIVYATAAATAPSGKTANITAEGYYFFDGSAWQKITGGAAVSDATTTTKGILQLAGDLAGTAASPTIASNAVTSAKILDGTIANADLAAETGGIYKGSGSLSGNTTVTQSANRLAFTSTATNGFSVDGTTLSVDAANNSVGIGTSTPDTSAALDITSTNKGLLVPRVALTSSTDATTISSPATGLIIYNTASAGSAPFNVSPGLYINNGTAAVPSWAGVQTYNDVSGNKSDKLRYLGSADINKTVVIDDFLEFRISQSGTTYTFAMRLTKNPGTNITYRYTRIGYSTSANFGFNSSFTFTSANYNTWQAVDTPVTVAGAALGFHGSFSSPQRNRFHEFILSLSFNEFVNLVFNSY